MIKNVRLTGLNTKAATAFVNKLWRWFNKTQMFML